MTRAQLRIADKLADGGRILYDVKSGYIVHPVSGPPLGIMDATVFHLMAKAVIKGNGDAMFGAMPQSFVFDPGCLR